MDRRKFIQSAATAPLAAATAGVSGGGAVGGVLGSGVFEETFAAAIADSGSAGHGSDVRSLARKYLERNAAAAFVKQYGLPQSALDNIERVAHDNASFCIDADIKAKKSFSESFKFLEQKKRNIERLKKRVLDNIHNDISMISQARALGVPVDPGDFRIW